jgi:hypothetical protein
MATKTANQATPQVLEKGNIYFVYRPRVEHEEVNSIDDIQQTHIILDVDGKSCFRLITLGKKSLPELHSDNSQGWSFVEVVSDSAKDLEAGLREEVYETKTRGERHQPAVRPVGEGVYKIVESGNETRLVYALELPDEIGPAQQELNIDKTGNYVISVKNPDKPTPAGQGFQQGDRKADFPKDLQKAFGDRRFIAVNPIDFLNYPGAEILLISTASAEAQDVGAELDPQPEDASTSEAINKLRMRKTRHPLAPLLEGELT